MISLNRLLKINIAFAFIVIAFLGCEEESKKKEFIARVNNAYLTNDDIISLDSFNQNTFARNEIIKRWIDCEVLFQEAEKQGITKDDRFNRIIDYSRRELAASMLIQKYLDDKLEKPSSSELEEFYEQFKDEFRTNEEIYVFNSVIFNDENTVIRFRAEVFKLSWEKAVENFLEEKSLINHSEDVTLPQSQIYPMQLSNLIQELNPGELSIIVDDGSSKYYLVQLLKVFKKGNILPLSLVQDKVEARYNSIKRSEIIREYLKELYSDNKVEIKEN